MIDIKLKEIILKSETFKFEKELYKEKNGINYLFSSKENHIIFKKLLPNTFDYEIYSYERLTSLNITIPKLLMKNKKENYIIKEFILGEPAINILQTKEISNIIFMELFKLSELLNSDNFDINYHPINFIINNDSLIYMYYKVYPYSEEYNLNNHGIYYWLNKKNLNKDNLDKDSQIIFTEDNLREKKELLYKYILWKHSNIY